MYLSLLKLLQVFRKNKRPIVHLVRLYKGDGSNVDICRRKKIEDGFEVVIPDSDGAQIVEELKPEVVNLHASLLLQDKIQTISPNEFILYKPRWGAFYNTVLEKMLKKLRVSTIIIAGCNFPNCPRATIFEASERDFRIVIAEDAISGLYAKGIDEMEQIGCAVYSVKKIANLMQKK